MTTVTSNFLSTIGQSSAFSPYHQLNTIQFAKSLSVSSKIDELIFQFSKLGRKIIFCTFYFCNVFHYAYCFFFLVIQIKKTPLTYHLLFYFLN